MAFYDRIMQISHLRAYFGTSTKLSGAQAQCRRGDPFFFIYMW